MTSFVAHRSELRMKARVSGTMEGPVPVKVYQATVAYLTYGTIARHTAVKLYYVVESGKTVTSCQYVNALRCLIRSMFPGKTREIYNPSYCYVSSELATRWSYFTAPHNQVLLS